MMGLPSDSWNASGAGLRLRLRAGGAVGLGLVVLLGGCGTRVIERERPYAMGDAGQGWQLVMESETATLTAMDRPEFSRRDASLGSTPVSGVAAMLYPPTDRPSLERARRLWLDQNPSRPTVYLAPRDRRHRR